MNLLHILVIDPEPIPTDTAHAGRTAASPTGILQQMGLKVSRRPSTSDPENQRAKVVTTQPAIDL